MKGRNILCVSQASTAICMSHMDHTSPSSSTTTSAYGGRIIDRNNPIIRDARRPSLSVPCSSASPRAAVNPTPYHHLQKKTKNKSADQKRNSTSSSVAVTTELITPPGSSRYLLNKTDYVDGLSDLHDMVVKLKAVPVEEQKPAVHQDNANQPSPKSSPSIVKSNQVVVLRVSLHCKGCEGKVRKHISRMEGVTSFHIDFKSKKVTIEGAVTPLSVLASVSKVKSAQLWTSTASLDDNNR